MKSNVTYRDQIWRYQVRQWQDGPNRIVAIVADGCTDSISVAFALYLQQSLSSFIYDCFADEVIVRNY